MLSSAKIIVAIVLVYLAQLGEAFFFPVNAAEWAQYKTTYEKTYTTSTISETSAQHNYASNKNAINSHNIQYNLELRNYRLGINQFSDLKQYQIDALFPLTKQPLVSNDISLPAVQPAPETYNPILELGLQVEPQNQGTSCNSGWAYATAKAVELLQVLKLGQTNALPLSAQNLIDCAGGGNACRRQVPQQTFDYLAVFGQNLHLASDYPNRPTQSEPGMCLNAGSQKTQLAAYSRIRDGDDETMKKYIAAGYPVVVEVNPTFEFIHYAGGIFDAPRFSLSRGSHFVIVIGYGHETVTTYRPYWLVLNSFGPQWGENGFMRISRNAASPLAKSAILPIQLK